MLVLTMHVKAIKKLLSQKSIAGLIENPFTKHLGKNTRKKQAKERGDSMTQYVIKIFIPSSVFNDVGIEGD